MSGHKILWIDASSASPEQQEEVWETLRTYTDAHWITSTPGVFTALVYEDSRLLGNPVFAGCEIEDITGDEDIVDDEDVAEDSATRI